MTDTSRNHSVILEKCTNCGDCLKVCPTKSILRTETLHVIDTDTCEACDVCLSICPENAIKKSKPAGPS